MVRLGFYLGSATLMAMVLLALTVQGANEGVVIGVTLLIGMPIILFGYPWWLNRYRPASDVTRLKAHLEENGARVLSVQPAGVQTGGRSGPDWRNYLAEVRLPTGEQRVKKIGVQVTTFSYPAVRDWDHPPRLGYLR